MRVSGLYRGSGVLVQGVGLMIYKDPKGPSNSIVYTLGAQIPIKYLL